MSEKTAKYFPGTTFSSGLQFFGGYSSPGTPYNLWRIPGGSAHQKPVTPFWWWFFGKQVSHSPPRGGGHFGWTPWERGPLLLKRCPSNFLEDTRNLANPYPWLASMVLGYPGQNLIRVIKVIRISGVSKTIVDWAKKNGIGKERFSVIQPLKRVNLPNTMIKKNMACI